MKQYEITGYYEFIEPFSIYVEASNKKEAMKKAKKIIYKREPCSENAEYDKCHIDKDVLEV